MGPESSSDYRGLVEKENQPPEQWRKDNHSWHQKRISLTAASPRPSVRTPVSCSSLLGLYEIDHQSAERNRGARSGKKHRHVPFQPQRPRTTSEQIEVTQNCRPTIPVIKELVHEQMHRSSKRIYRKVSNIFCKCEQRECCTE
jgi:hypothetical protein